MKVFDGWKRSFQPVDPLRLLYKLASAPLQMIIFIPMKGYYIYVLQSEKDSLLYTGYTHDLKNRIKEHNSGYVPSTKNRQPLNLIYAEWCLNQTDVIAREKYLKSGMGKRYIRNRLKTYFSNL